MTDKTTEKDGLDEKEIINGEVLKDKIYVIRGRQVMLDYDLAKIYGYTTKMFNRQVARNIKKFEGEDFMFQLTRQEIESLSRCQNGTTINQNDDLSMSQNVTSIFMQAKGIKGGRVYLPYAFTEQGVYMLMTVLRGELAVKQSRALIMTFKAMKDYILESQDTISYRELLMHMSYTTDNAKTIMELQEEIRKMDGEIRENSAKISEMVRRSEIPPLFLDYDKMIESRVFLAFNEKPAKTAETYIDIYRRAKKSIAIIDNYINIRSLRLLQEVRPEVDITIFGDNMGHYLHQSDYEDFRMEFPELEINFIKTNGKIHDRFIMIDLGTKSERIYHCGASSKDAGRRLTLIHEIEDDFVKDAMREVVEGMRGNEKLELR